MKIKEVSHWVIASDTEALLFFAQRMDELSFIYTLDSYKPPCLTPSTLTEEALSALSDIENGTLDAQNLNPIIDELQWSIKQDIVSNGISPLPLEKIFNQITEKPYSEAKTRLQILNNHIRSEKYLTECLKSLSKSIAENRKKDIDSACKAFSATLVNWGISKQSIHEIVNDYFFNPEKTPYTEISFSGFIKKLPLSQKKYSVFFSTSKLIQEIYETSEIFNIHQYKKEDYSENTNNLIIEKLPSDKCIVCIKEIEAHDKQSALKIGEKKLEKIANLYSVFHHKNTVTWNSSTVVLDIKADDAQYVVKQNNALKNGFDLPPQKASKNLNTVIKNFSMSTDSSFMKFDSVVDLHGLATKSDSESSQLLNIWIAIETITPPNSKKSKIQNIIDASTPFLLNGYINRLMLSLKSDIYRWSKKEYRSIIKKIEPKELNPLEKITALVALEEHTPLRSELLAKLEEFPLLRNRIFNINQSIKNPKNTLALIDRHKQKVEWQIRRIYRTRNQIVHAGKSPTYMEGLVENAHSYLDQITNEVMKSCSEKKDATTIEQVHEIQRIKLEVYREEISKIKEYNTSNIKLILNET